VTDLFDNKLQDMLKKEKEMSEELVKRDQTIEELSTKKAFSEYDIAIQQDLLVPLAEEAIKEECCSQEVFAEDAVSSGELCTISCSSTVYSDETPAYSDEPIECPAELVEYHDESTECYPEPTECYPQPTECYDEPRCSAESAESSDQLAECPTEPTECLTESTECSEVLDETPCDETPCDETPCDETPCDETLCDAPITASVPSGLCYSPAHLALEHSVEVAYPLNEEEPADDVLCPYRAKHVFEGDMWKACSACRSFVAQAVRLAVAN
jgi:hypothetical protein